MPDEPLRTTLQRNLIIALVAGAIFTLLRLGNIAYWPAATILALWPSLGGHYVELAFLRLNPRTAQAPIRLLVWIAGGIVLLAGMKLTAQLLPGFPPMRWPAWWMGGPLFAALELVVHVTLYLRGRPSIYAPNTPPESPHP